ncbi:MULTISPECIES: hypothetical protein [unclassified Agromyces]|uniref:hypothetical protein n=1 Tax=unclassified Agromyces TaxID=2639701 RepID=UPI003015274F
MDRAFPETPDGFVLARDIRAAGREAELYAAVGSGELQRVRRGVFMRPCATAGTTGSELDAARYLASVRACALTRRAPVFTSYSAVALAGLRIVGSWPRHLHVLSRDGNGSRRGDVISVARTADVPTTLTAGLMTTTLEFTLVQLARHAPLVVALVATDAALSRSRGRGAPAPLTSLDALRAEHERLLPYHGSRRVEAVLERAAVGAETPLETVSRVVIEEFGFPPPVLQHRLVLDASGRSAYLDFFWPEYGIGAEADGRGKYLGDGVAATVDAVLAEKAREDAIRLQVAGFARWDWAEMWQREPIRARLAQVGLPVTRRPVRLFTRS